MSAERCAELEAALADLIAQTDDIAADTRDPIDQNYIAITRASWEMLHACADRVGRLLEPASSASGGQARCPNCKADDGAVFVDRTICVCGVQHTRCVQCGWPHDARANEAWRRKHAQALATTEEEEQG